MNFNAGVFLISKTVFFLLSLTMSLGGNGHKKKMFPAFDLHKVEYLPAFPLGSMSHKGE